MRARLRQLHALQVSTRVQDLGSIVCRRRCLPFIVGVGVTAFDRIGTVWKSASASAAERSRTLGGFLLFSFSLSRDRSSTSPLDVVYIKRSRSEAQELNYLITDISSSSGDLFADFFVGNSVFLS